MFIYVHYRFTLLSCLLDREKSKSEAKRKNFESYNASYVYIKALLYNVTCTIADWQVVCIRALDKNELSI